MRNGASNYYIITIIMLQLLHANLLCFSLISNWVNILFGCKHRIFQKILVPTSSKHLAIPSIKKFDAH